MKASQHFIMFLFGLIKYLSMHLCVNFTRRNYLTTNICDREIQSPECSDSGK